MPIQGIQGLQGVTGSVGISGIQGVQGVIGPYGLQGATGPTGPSGYKGNMFTNSFSIPLSTFVILPYTQSTISNSIAYSTNTIAYIASMSLPTLLQNKAGILSCYFNEYRDKEGVHITPE